MSEDYYTHRNGVSRFQFMESSDDKKVGYGKVKGLSGEEFDKVFRVQPHGFASNPINGAHGVGLSMGGRRDNLLLLGGEHHDKRPRNLGGGNSAFYNADGTVMKLIGKDLTIDAAGNATINVKSYTIKAGGVTFKISGDGVEITGGKVTHDGIKIDKTHGHVSAPAGPSGPPVS